MERSNFLSQNLFLLLFQIFTSQQTIESDKESQQEGILCIYILNRTTTVDKMDMGGDSPDRSFNVHQQQGGIPTMFSWNHGAKEVAMAGSWDGWKTIEALHGSGEDFDILKFLPSGVYNYMFLVDGIWRFSPDQPSGQDEYGNTYNILDLKDYVPEEVGSISDLEPPPSPDSSYNNAPLVEEDFDNKPPMLPPQLTLTLLNSPRPSHVVLNHLYVNRQDEGSPPFVALGSTSRFRSKYVTTVLYTPCKGKAK